MKKVMILVAVLFLASFSTSAFSATINAGTSTTIGGGDFAVSNGVQIAVLSQATSYAAQSCHISGTYMYGTGGGDAFTGNTSEIKRTDIPSQSGTSTLYCAVTEPTSATALSF